MPENKTTSDESVIDVIDSNQDGKISLEEIKSSGKHVLKSKTIWVNVLALLAFIAQKYTGFVIDETLQIQLLTVINIILRAVTKESIKW